MVLVLSGALCFAIGIIAGAILTLSCYSYFNSYEEADDKIKEYVDGNFDAVVAALKILNEQSIDLHKRIENLIEFSLPRNND